MNFYSKRNADKFIKELEEKKEKLLQMINDLRSDYISLKSYFGKDKEHSTNNIFRCSKNLRDLGMLYQGIKRLANIEFEAEEEESEQKKPIKNDDDLMTGLSLFDF